MCPQGITVIIELTEAHLGLSISMSVTPHWLSGRRAALVE